MKKNLPKWELRRALRHGSEHIRFEDGLKAAKEFAIKDVFANGNVGELTLVDHQKRILYYTTHKDDQ